MRHWQRRTFALIGMGLASLLATGCGDPTSTQSAAEPAASPAPASSEPASSEPASSEPAPAASKSAPATQVEPATQQPAPQPIRQDSPATAEPTSEATEAAIPEVLLSEQHAATCKVQVGDTMPDVTLVDLNGQEVHLSPLLGQRLTILFFWSPESYMSQAQLTDMGPDFAVPTSGQGVNVIGVAVNQTPEAARQHTTAAGATFPNFADPQGAAFATVATAKLPRTYVLDAQGKILWFDLEYSRTTRRQLNSVLQHVLGK